MQSEEVENQKPIVMDELPVGWPDEFEHFKGPQIQLDGLNIYHDFHWTDEIDHPAHTFINGKAIARRVRQECRTGHPNKEPALLLTTVENSCRCFTTDDEFIAVINIHEAVSYIPEAGAAFLAKKRRQILTPEQAPHIEVLPEALKPLLDKNLTGKTRDAYVLEHLTSDVIQQLAKCDPQRLKELNGILQACSPTGDTEGNPATPGEVIEVLRGLPKIEKSTLAELQKIMLKHSGEEELTSIIESVASSVDGLELTQVVMAGKILDRIDRVIEISDEYSSMIEGGCGETAAQNYIEKNPWLIGLEYVQVRPRKEAVRGAMDFLMQRYDGFHDILELKSPTDPIMLSAEITSGGPPPPCRYSLSLALAGAIAQAHAYREQLSSNPKFMEEQRFIKNTRDPKIVIVIGQEKDMQGHQKKILDEIRRSLHRVEIIPFDLVAARAQIIVNNAKKYLLQEANIDAPGSHPSQPELESLRERFSALSLT